MGEYRFSSVATLSGITTFVFISPAFRSSPQSPARANRMALLPVAAFSWQQLELHWSRSMETSLSSISILLSSSCRDGREVEHLQACLGKFILWVKVTWLSLSEVCSVYSASRSSSELTSSAEDLNMDEQQLSTGMLML